MVNTALKQPRYDLQKMQIAAAREDGFAITPRARQDAENLEMPELAVRNLIRSLTPSDFDHVWLLRDDRKRLILDPEGKEIAMDVYFPWITAPNGAKCQVYLKMKFSESTISVTSVQSLHQQRK